MRAPQGSSVRLVAVAALLQLLVSSSVAVRGGSDSGRAPDVAARGSAAPVVDERATAVRELLAARATAVRTRDKAAFLAGIDPAATALRARQAAVFDALATVPVVVWEYELDAGRERPRDPDLDARFGRGWWAPQVDLRVALKGVEAHAARLPQHLVFVPRGDRWLLAADDAFAHLGDDSARGIWDFGPVRAVRGRRTLVLAHPGGEAVARQAADLVDAAVPKVSRVWGRDWSQQVLVLVPRTQEELSRLVDTPVDLTRIAAVATAEVLRREGSARVLGERVVINPGPFGQLGALGRRVVLTHEVVHVATRAETGPAAPSWLVEGFADWVAYRDVRLPLSVTARQLRDAVRAGRGPRELPRDEDYDGGDAGVSRVYETSWQAVSYLAERYGEAKLLAFYRAVGAASGDPGTAVDDAFRSVLGTTRGAFVRDWLRALEERFA